MVKFEVHKLIIGISSHVINNYIDKHMFINNIYKQTTMKYYLQYLEIFFSNVIKRILLYIYTYIY